MKKQDKKFIEELTADIYAVCGDETMSKKIAYELHGKYMKRPNRKRLITYKGKTRSLTEWAREYGFGFCTLRERLARGMSFEDALTLPPNYAHGKTKVVEQYDMSGNLIKRHNSTKEAAEAVFVTTQAISFCIRRGRGTCAGYIWKYAKEGNEK